MVFFWILKNFEMLGGMWIENWSESILVLIECDCNGVKYVFGNVCYFCLIFEDYGF